MRWIEAHQPAVVVRDSFEDFDGLVRPESLFAIPSVVKVLVPILDVDGEAEFAELGLLVATATFLTLADLNALREIQNSTEASLAVPDLEDVLAVLNLFQVVVGLRTLFLLVRADLAR